MSKRNQRTFNDSFVRGLKLPGVQRLQGKDGKPYTTTAGKPYKLSESASRGAGRLTIRVLPTGVKEFFYRYRKAGDDKTIALGRYDWRGVNGKTLAEINEALADARREQRITGDVKAHRDANEHRKMLEGRKGTMRQLLAAYLASLRSAGKPTADQIEGIFRRHVLKPFPELADKKAASIEGDDITRILARMVRKGIKRHVNMARSYISAAFSYGMKADHDPRTTERDGVLFGLKGNPVAFVPRIGEYEKAGQRTLTADELRAFWQAIEALPTVQRQTLRFDLALACQRPTQLLRADWSDFDFSSRIVKDEHTGKNLEMGRTLLLRDPKGRSEARDHLLPLTDFAMQQLKPLQTVNSLADLQTPFTADQKRRMVLTTLSAAVREVSDKLHKDKEIPKFQMRDLRRTAETMLQQLGVAKEVRAHLLSHGRAQGVQGQHYERYDFLPEKREALEKWARHLDRIITGKSAKLIPLPTAGRAA